MTSTAQETVIYADGCYDLFHSGHARQLEQAKKSGSQVKLVVGISGMAETEEKKGRMLLNDQERNQIVGFCKYVDDIILPCPWEPTVDFLKEKGMAKIAHDAAPYGADGSQDIYAKFKEEGMFLETQRTGGISTTDLIVDIIRNKAAYQTYLLDNEQPAHKVGLNALTEKVLRVRNFLVSSYNSWVCPEQCL